MILDHCVDIFFALSRKLWCARRCSVVSVDTLSYPCDVEGTEAAARLPNAIKEAQRSNIAAVGDDLNTGCLDS
jgi:hypothetical protein